MVDGSRYLHGVLPFFFIFSTMVFLNCPVTISLECISKTQGVLILVKPHSHLKEVVVTELIQIDILNSLMTSFAEFSFSPITTTISGTQLFSASRQERSFSTEPSKDTTAARSVFEVRLFTKIE